MNEQTKFFIPDNVKVGFQNREGTYTGRLAYIVGVDKKGVRKEISWEGWRDKKIKAEDYVNEPTEGFVLNKNGGGGGGRGHYGYNGRQAFIRVYDPRNFEFEISIANLVFILRETGCDPGKGLDGQFVYAWDRDKLVLMPVKSQEYTNAKDFTKLQTKSVKAKELIPGAVYKTKKQETLTYLGKFEKHGLAHPNISRWDRGFSGLVKTHVFLKDKHYVFLDSLKSLASVENDTPVANFAELVEKYYKSHFGSKVVKFFTVEQPRKSDSQRDVWTFQENQVFYTASNHYGWQNNGGERPLEAFQTLRKYFIKDGMATFENYSYFARNPNVSVPNYRYNSYSNHGTMSWREPTNLGLWVLLESGTKAKVENLWRQD